jgi:hypothetical protein
LAGDAGVATLTRVTVAAARHAAQRRVGRCADSVTDFGSGRARATRAVDFLGRTVSHFRRLKGRDVPNDREIDHFPIDKLTPDLELRSPAHIRSHTRWCEQRVEMANRS